MIEKGEGEKENVGTAMQLLVQTKKELAAWSWFKKSLLLFALLIFATSSFLYLTPPGLAIREFLAQTVISTQHRDWAWIFVGAEKRDYMVRMSHQFTETSALEKQDLQLIKHERRPRSIDELISEVKDISGQFWKGKMIYVYDPTSVRVVVPNKAGEGERISSMVKRTGAVAGINGGGFIDPDGLGNGFAPIGLILSNFDPIYTDVDADTPQHIIGFTKEGTLLVGKYSLNELRQLGAKEAVSFLAPRLIANGNPQITSGDGGWGRAPRTAIGQKEDGTLIFVVIDGRQTHSVGATLREVQDLLLKEGAINAGLLDGGASSELVIKGEVVTKPSSRYGERRLPSGLLVFDNPDDYKADRIWDGITHIDPGGRHDHPDYLREQQMLKQQQQQQQQQQSKKTEPAKTPDPVKPGTNGETDKPAAGKTNEAPAAGPGAGGTQPANGAGNAPKPGAGGGAGTPNGGTGGGQPSGAPGGATQTPGGSGGAGAKPGETSGPAPGTGGTGGATGPAPGAAGGTAKPSSGTGTAPAPGTGATPAPGTGSGAGTGASGSGPTQTQTQTQTPAQTQAPGAGANAGSGGTAAGAKNGTTSGTQPNGTPTAPATGTNIPKP